MKISQQAPLTAALAMASFGAAADPLFQPPGIFMSEPIGMAVVGLALLAIGVWRWRKIT